MLAARSVMASRVEDGDSFVMRFDDTLDPAFGDAEELEGHFRRWISLFDPFQQHFRPMRRPAAIPPGSLPQGICRLRPL